MLIDPDAFEGCFSRWAQSLAVGVEREVVAIDGKTVRRSGSRRQITARCTWSAPGRASTGWCWPTRGRRQVERDHGVPELLDGLDLEGCLVTLDAIGCQKEIAAQIRARGGDYLLASRATRAAPAR